MAEAAGEAQRTPETTKAAPRLKSGGGSATLGKGGSYRRGDPGNQLTAALVSPLMANDDLRVACEHCRTICSITKTPTHTKFRCHACNETTPIKVGIPLAKNLTAERAGDKDRKSIRILVALIAGTLGVILMSWQVVSCSNKQQEIDRLNQYTETLRNQSR